MIGRLFSLQSVTAVRSITIRAGEQKEGKGRGTEGGEGGEREGGAEKKGKKRQEKNGKGCR